MADALDVVLARSVADPADYKFLRTELTTLRAQVETLTRERDAARSSLQLSAKALLAQSNKVRRLVECVRTIEEWSAPDRALHSIKEFRALLATVSDITAPEPNQTIGEALEIAHNRRDWRDDAQDYEDGMKGGRSHDCERAC
jgi:hypothetical protein